MFTHYMKIGSELPATFVQGKSHPDKVVQLRNRKNTDASWAQIFPVFSEFFVLC